MGSVSLIARLGDSSSHGGVIITSASTARTEGILTARVGDLHVCPIPGHGVTPITNGSGNFKCEGKITAVDGSICGCRAVITAGSTTSFAPLESPSNAGRLGTAVLGGPDIPPENGLIMG
jgi:uncharacterized Zn-binding protein involved in type VI secretion